MIWMGSAGLDELCSGILGSARLVLAALSSAALVWDWVRPPWAGLGWVRLGLGWGQLGSTWIGLAGLGMHITYKALDYLHMRIPNPSK